MATLSHYPLISHLRAEPNQHVLHFKSGQLIYAGAGVAYWFNPLSASIAQVPIEDNETTFMLHERSADFQDVAIQICIRYRCVDPQKLANRVNFGISLRLGTWLEQPLERLATFWSQRAQGPARAWVMAARVEAALAAGGEAVRTAIVGALGADAELPAMGLAVVDVQVVSVAASAEVEKALQTPTREGIQQKADEAIFSRRALAVEKERAIKENEINTQIELAKKESLLIAQNATNELDRVRAAAEAERMRTEAALERDRLGAEAYARDILGKACGDAAAHRELNGATLDYEERRLKAYENLSPALLLGLAAQEAARKIQQIQHLNISPDLLGSSFQQMLRDNAGK